MRDNRLLTHEQMLYLAALAGLTIWCIGATLLSLLLS